MVLKIHPRGVIWVPSSHHPVVFLAPLNSPMRRPSIKKSVAYSIVINMFKSNLRRMMRFVLVFISRWQKTIIEIMLPTNPKIPITGIRTALIRNHKVESETKRSLQMSIIYIYTLYYTINLPSGKLNSSFISFLKFKGPHLVGSEFSVVIPAQEITLDETTKIIEIV